MTRCQRTECEVCDKEEQRQLAKMAEEDELFVGLVVNVKELKMLRETLCLAQSSLGVYNFSTFHHISRVGNLIKEIDKHRPLGSDGKHGNLHTPTCGCEDK